jgi:HSP20 family protein
LSNPWWRRRKKKSPWFTDIYDELEKLGDMIDETMQKAFDGSSENTAVRRNRIKGYYVKIGPDGKPKIREFDSTQLPEEEADIDDDVEPLVDFIEEGELLVVLVALPGVKKDAIELRVTESCLTVSVDADNLEWYDELELPARVKPKSASASYKNGILKVKLNKLEKVVKDSKIL